MNKMALGDRMKDYEKAYDFKIPKRLPMIIRVDGRCFHSLLKDAKKPFDDVFRNAMDEVARELLKEVQGAVFAFVQSDEISLLVKNYSSLDYSPFFNNELQKILASTASIATRKFGEEYYKPGLFDSKVFILPKEEVCNYFIWRQRDWTRNSVQMVARSYYSHKQLQGKNQPDLHDMIFKQGLNWNDLPVWKKRGRGIIKKVIPYKETFRTRIEIDNDIPIFSHDREFIEKFVRVE